MNASDFLAGLTNDNDDEILKDLNLIKSILNKKLNEVNVWSDKVNHKEKTIDMIVDLNKENDYLIEIVKKGDDQTMEEIDECLAKLPVFMGKVNKLQEFLP